MSTELLLLVTESQVHAFDMSRQQRVSIGRHDSNDLPLASRTVSNFHAEIVRDTDGYTIRDLGSTNGTYVDGQQIQTGRLANGACVRIGNHVMRMQLERSGDADEGFVRYSKTPSMLSPGTRGCILSFAGQGPRRVTIPGKEPTDFTLPDLLKALCAHDGASRAVLARGSDRGAIWVRKRQVYHVEYQNAVGEKALYRLFRWRDGGYVIEPDGDEPVPRSITLPVDALILEGTKSTEELGRLISGLPPLEAPLRLKEDCPLPLTAHSPDEIEMFQLIVRHQTIASVLEQSTLADVRLLRLIESLLRKGVFETRSPDGSLDETMAPSRPRHDA